ncbi:BglG family transcription antiterminator [Metabacillus sp. RGM 3146]|uniref:BglG family transcription antiterminator n=1 Tax=Metabacillus sp. RGM 3146 TaxID=3401092 RepID=UPI003B9DBE75
MDYRSSQILRKIALAPRYIPASEIMEDLNISKRTVYYDVEKINDWLQANGFEPLIYVRSAGFYLDDETRAKIRNTFEQNAMLHAYEYSPEERRILAAVMILTRDTRICLETFLERFQVSRSTMLMDIRQIKKLLENYNVKLTFHKQNGYSISGSEQEKRALLASCLTELMNHPGWKQLIGENQPSMKETGQTAQTIFPALNTAEITHLLNEAEQVIGVRYTDDVISSLSVHIVSLMKRISQGKFVSMDTVEKEVIGQSREFSAAKTICHKFESVYSLKIPEDEIYYMATYLLGSNISRYESDPENDQETVNLKRVISQMVDDFEAYACVLFEKRTELEKNLFLHLKPAYYRIKYGIEMKNPLSSLIKTKYQDIYVLTEKVVHHFEQILGKEISKDEIAYMAMHFGGWIEEEGVTVDTRKKAAVVCASGVGTSRILQKQLEGLIPSLDIVKVMTKREYETSSLNQIDLVITTTQIEEHNVPVFTVSPILSHEDKTNLLSHIKPSSDNLELDKIGALMTIIKKHSVITDEKGLQEELARYLRTNQNAKKEKRKKPMLHEILTQETIQFCDCVDNWKDAIRLGAAPLLESGSVEESYVDAMIENVEKLGPYVVIAPKIALPHARPEDGVKKIGMSFLRIKEGCAFSEKPEHKVNLLFVLAAIDNDTHLKALSQFSSMLSEPGNIDRLIQAETADEVLQVIQKYSTK